MHASAPRGRARGACVLVAAVVLALGMVVSIVAAEAAPASDASSGPLASRIPSEDPLNSGFLLLNMHGMLFHPDVSDIDEDLAYARWLGGGIIRVFATDSNGLHSWDGARVGERIAEIAPRLREAHLRLIVAFVNNHQVVPGELDASAGWMDNYIQLLLPFYTSNWHGPYLQFVRELVSTVQAYDAQDVIFAWELGNELHTPLQPAALMTFVTEASAEVRSLDPVTPILPGTMGANHVEPGNHYSPIARWLYCDAPVDAYTLHAYDWVSRERPGDMPIDWDLDNIVAEPCPNGRTLPVIVEELGTSRELPGVYGRDDERGRLAQEQRQIDFVRHFREVIGFGVWNAESPRLVDRTFIDTRRGLTSYGSRAQGGGSCYDPTPDAAPAVRCQLEQFLRDSRFLRVAESDQWTPGVDVDADEPTPLVGRVDPVFTSGDNASTLTISGWVYDPAASDWPGIDALEVFVGPRTDIGSPLAQAQLGMTRGDVPSAVDNPDLAHAGFSVRLPLESVPLGPTALTLVAHTPDHGTWLSSVQVVIPTLGAIPPARAVIPIKVAPAAAPRPRLAAEIESPQAGDQVSRNFVLQMLAPDGARVDVFMEPDRDNGGRLVGSASVSPTDPAGNLLKTTITAPVGSHTLYVHVTSAVLDQEQLLTLPVVIRS